MQYLNPLRIFNANPTDSTAWETLQRELQQKIERNYSEQEVIFAYGQRLSVASWRRVLAEMRSPEAMQAHARVLEDKPLLNFLEFGHLGFFRRAAEVKPQWDTAFIGFVAPYFAAQFGDSLRQAVQRQDLGEVETLLTSSIPLPEAYQEECFEPTFQYLSAAVLDLNRLQAEDSLAYMSERELVAQLPDPSIALYNQLPTYFAELRQALAGEAYNLAVQLGQNFGRPDGAIAIVRQALKLEIDDRARQALEQMLQLQTRRQRPGMPLWFWVGIGLIGTLFLLKYLEVMFFS